MALTSVGDLAHSFLLKRQNTFLKTDLQRLTSEVTTGHVADAARHLRGDFQPLSAIDTSLARLGGFRHVTNTTAMFTEAMQTVLERVDTLAADLGPALLVASSNGGPQQIDAVAAAALQSFKAAVSALNTRFADRSLMAGRTPQMPALVDAATLLSQVQTAASGAVSPADLELALDDWFDDPAGFLAMAYVGGAATGDLPVANGESVSLDVTAADPAIRNTLKALAMGALLAGGAFAGSDTARADLAQRSAERLAETAADRASLTGRLGTVQAQVEQAATRNNAETTALGIARTALVEVDPYDSAAQLEAVQTRLETLYALTARITRLSLVDYL